MRRRTELGLLLVVMLSLGTVIQIAEAKGPKGFGLFKLASSQTM